MYARLKKDKHTRQTQHIAYLCKTFAPPHYFYNNIIPFTVNEPIDKFPSSIHNRVAR